MLKTLGTASKIIETKNGDHPDRIQGAIVSELSSRSGHDWFFSDEAHFQTHVRHVGKIDGSGFSTMKNSLLTRFTHCARMATHLKKCVGKGEL